MINLLKPILIVVSLILMAGCAYDFQKEAVYTWDIMQERIPECRNRAIPMIIIDEKFDDMGRYFRSFNVIVLKYKYTDVLEHELLHACGYILEEN